MDSQERHKILKGSELVRVGRVKVWITSAPECAKVVLNEFGGEDIVKVSGGVKGINLKRRR